MFKKGNFLVVVKRNSGRASDINVGSRENQAVYDLSSSLSVCVCVFLMISIGSNNNNKDEEVPA